MAAPQMMLPIHGPTCFLMTSLLGKRVTAQVSDKREPTPSHTTAYAQPDIDRQLKAYALSGIEQDTNSDCGNLDSDTCWSPECDDLGDAMKDMYWIFREFNNLRTGLKAFRNALEAATLTSSLNISTVIAEIAEPLIKKQVEVRSSSSGVFKALGMGLSIAAPFVAIGGPAGGAASALIGMAGNKIPPSVSMSKTEKYAKPRFRCSLNIGW